MWTYRSDFDRLRSEGYRHTFEIEEMERTVQRMNDALQELKQRKEQLQQQPNVLRAEANALLQQIENMDGKGEQTLQTLFREANAWARHYSMVRMTVTTFVMGAVVSLISVKWSNFEPALAISIWALWVAMLWIFHTFTVLERNAFYRRKRNLNLLLAYLKMYDRVQAVPDRPKCCEIAPGQREHLYTFLGLATIGLACLTFFWHGAKPAEPRISVAPGEITIQFPTDGSPPAVTDGDSETD